MVRPEEGAAPPETTGAEPQDPEEASPPNPDDMPPLMTIRQAARILGDMPERTVRLLCEKGTVYAVKIGRQWRVNRDDLYRLYRIRSRFVKIDEGPVLVRCQATEPTRETALA